MDSDPSNPSTKRQSDPDGAFCQVILEYIVCQAECHTIYSASYSVTDFLSQNHPCPTEGFH
jgi:hypothetical protein